MRDCLFYKRNCHSIAEPPCPSGYEWRMWRPALWDPIPAGLPFLPFFVWWLFHQFRVFANRGYAILLISQAGRVVHRSVLTPKYFRFPFMSAGDLQIGDTWTDQAHRGKGLATFAVQAALASADQRTYWYIVERANASSIRVVEKIGFTLVGTGTRKSRFGVRSLGVYVLNSAGLTGSLPTT
jgi:RimJ/RimL family protein N-acetyltransferase